MVIFEDFRKLLLYQKLNLGFECELCKKKFYNRIDHLEHTRSCQNVPDLKCPKCGKTFGHFRILQLHLKIHNVSESLSPQSAEVEVVKNESPSITLSEHRESSNLDTDNSEHKESEDKVASTSVNISFDEPGVSSTFSGDKIKAEESATNSFKILDTGLAKKKSSHRAKEKPKQAKKPVGLTKIKMEDCLRCDACSCIYIDEKDYFKHMRNFHQKDVNKAPIKQQKARRKCQSCCKQCRGSHCTPIKRPRATQRASNLIFRFNMKDNIKNRWSQMVSQQLSETVTPDPASRPNESVPSDPKLGEPELYIKPDPDANITIKQEPEPDLSYLLTQVEVKIKTEPPDDY